MKCPFCGVELELTPEFADRVVRCPQCSEFFKTPPFVKCPVCERGVWGRPKLCVGCGYNFETGMLERTTTGPEQESLSLPQKAVVYLCDNLPGLFRASTLIGAVICAVLAVLVAGLGLAMIGMGVFLTGIFILAAAMMVYLQGLAFLCTGHFCLLRSAYEEMTGSTWSLFLILGFLPLIAVLIVMGMVKNA